jgi:hypothetical protein
MPAAVSHGPVVLDSSRSSATPMISGHKRSAVATGARHHARRSTATPSAAATTARRRWTAPAARPVNAATPANTTAMRHIESAG